MDYKNNISSYILLFVIVAIVLAAPVIDKMFTNESMEKMITQTYGDQFSWCVSLSFSSNSTQSSSERTYILIPQIFSDLDLVSIVQVNDDIPTLSIVNYGALIIMLVYSGIGFAVWKYKNRKTIILDKTAGSGGSDPAP